MSGTHVDVSEPVNQALSLSFQLVGLQEQLFRFSDDLDFLYKAYDGLQMVTVDCGVDAENVSAVLFGLNAHFHTLVTRLDALRQTINPNP
jgi:hypothetical protein